MYENSINPSNVEYAVTDTLVYSATVKIVKEYFSDSIVYVLPLGPIRPARDRTRVLELCGKQRETRVYGT